ncbi:hypothetical protein DRE_05081 [Drechslerella stenobrocha 248]|uniref:DUF1783-domain-containing protein n=1 Tax=Drechslerella stenobrocha 248 TaxID=1043628 RepID=W7HRD8_9PEZI|nr:hypothetical protein DRE_05081 [Drechslerella stenobrocha 248]
MSRPALSRLAGSARRPFPSAFSRLPSPMLLRRPPSVVLRRTLIAAPKEGGPPLLERSADRDLPDVAPRRRYLLHIPLFLLSMYIATNLLFNYQRSSSSVVSSTLYALRVSPDARNVLGDEISFKAKTIPWIHGTMDQMHGRIDISYKVKGTQSEGLVRFTSLREGGKMGKFKTQRWSLEMPDGRVLNLLANDT